MRGIELFAGAGGLALGLELAGVQGVAFVEIERTACDTLRYNRPRWRVVEADVQRVNFREYYDQVDLVSGDRPARPSRTRESAWASPIPAARCSMSLPAALERSMRPCSSLRTCRG